MRLRYIPAMMAGVSTAIAARSVIIRQSSVAVLAAADAAYPVCALKCMAVAIPASTCSPTDVVCLCANTALQNNITLCAKQSCTVEQLLTTKNVTETMCGAPVRDRTKQTSYIGVIGGGVALISFLLRCLSSVMRLRQWGMDDWAMCLVIALALPPTVFSVILADNGLGKDMWTLKQENITNVLFYYYLGECFYLAAIATIKVSFCLLFTRLFREKPFIYYVYGTMALSVAYGIAFVTSTIIQCRPISYGWNGWDGLHTGTCNNVNLEGWMSSIFNIILDIMVIGLPLRKLSQLVMTWERKVTVMCMFSLGLFVTTVSIVRLSSLIQFANSQNPTWDYVPAAYFSLLELHVGIVCGCLPALRPLVKLIVPRLVSTIGKYSKSSNTGPSSAGGNNCVNGVEGGNIDMGDFIPLNETYTHSKINLTAECTAV